MREDEGREGPVNSASARGEGSVCRESIYVYILYCVWVCVGKRMKMFARGVCQPGVG